MSGSGPMRADTPGPEGGPVTQSSLDRRPHQSVPDKPPAPVSGTG
jgi:hypothetical protein